MKTFFASLKRGTTSRAAVLVTLVVLATPQTARADSFIFVTTPIPNWGLGSPQPVILRGCSELDLIPNTCFGSDFESLQLLGNNFATFAFSTDLLPGPGGLDIIVPFANWLRPGFFIWRDAPAIIEPFASDAIFLFNRGLTAHMFLASNNSDDPLASDPAFCAGLDAVYPGTCATMPAPTDISSSVDQLTGEFTLDIGDNTFSEAPEPSTLILFGTGLAGLAYVRRRRART